MLEAAGVNIEGTFPNNFEGLIQDKRPTISLISKTHKLCREI